MSRAANYRLYGIIVRSSAPLPCPRAAASAEPDVRLLAAAPSRFARARLDAAPRTGRQDWFRCLRLPDGTTYLRWTRLFEFLVSPDGRRISYCRHQNATQEALGVYLLGQVLSFSLLSMGIESLHGTVVVIDDGAVAFVGDCGYGKSTLGAAMLAKGFPVLTDDLIALRESAAGCVVQPGVPRIKLFPSVVRRVFRRKPSGTPMNPRTPKLVLPLAQHEVVGRPVPLKAIYVLSPPRARSNRLERPRVRPLGGRQAFLEVVRSTFNLLVLREERLAGQFRFARGIAATVPIRQLSYPRDLSQLPEVCNVVLGDLAKLGTQRTATAQ